MTVGEMVDDILNDMDSDPVTLYNDTEESRQVAQILKTTYYNLIDGRDWPNLYKPFQLAESSVATPTHMTFGLDVMSFKYIKYNVRQVTDTRDKFVEIKFYDPQDFMRLLDVRDSSAANVTKITDTTGIFLNIYNDRAPSYYTSFDEKTVIFDAHDSAVETFLKTVKTQCYGRIEPVVTLSDGFYFDLPTDAFSLLLNTAKSVSSITLKQMPNLEAKEAAITQKRRMSQEKWKKEQGIKYPDYGRKRGSTFNRTYNG